MFFINQIITLRICSLGIIVAPFYLEVLLQIISAPFEAGCLFSFMRPKIGHVIVGKAR
jgi:hypothetical protein